METIHIFGDSYAREYDYELYPYVWSNRLKSQFNIKNYAEGGTGPDWSLQKIINLVNEIEDTSSYLIFCLTDIYRLNFRGFEPRDQFMVSKLLTRPEGDSAKDLKKLFKKYMRYRSMINVVYRHLLSYSSYHDTEILKIILYVKFFSDKFKKILILPCFDELTLTIDVLKKINENNFYVHSKSLFRYAEEIKGWYDERPNHLEKSQHTLLYNDILQILNA